ncbi:MAG: A/G-specific adenine glycosylase [Xanthobacteraceae bacterium]
MTLSAAAGKRKARTDRAGVASGRKTEGARLLAWYDRHRRDLPWRARAGEPRDPYRVWVSEIMLQQTTVSAVVPYFHRFMARFRTVEDLAAANLDEVLRLWAGLGYYARGRNLHACARVVVERHGGEFPRTLAELRALPGVGDYTAAAIAAITYDEPVVPVDGNIERVVARLFAIDAPLSRAKPLIRNAAAGLVPRARAGDFAQALMDLGATICTPKNPACLHCPLRGNCLGQAQGAPEIFPVKEGKRQGRLRRGAAFVVLRADGAVLLRTRPARGLLGGMTEVPTTVWTHDFDERSALDHAPSLSRPCWRRIPGTVTHTFTHFPLELIVYVAKAARTTKPPAGARWVADADLSGEALPGVMRKVLAHAGIDPS